MKLFSLISLFFATLIFTPFAYASEHPDGSITIYNASQHDVTAQVSNVGKFTLAANQSKEVGYSTLSYACSDTPTNCRTNFYVNDKPAGSATIDVQKGKVVTMHMSLKVKTTQAQSVLRSVVIK